MRTLRKILAVIVLSAVPVAALAVPAGAADGGKTPVTVADFAVMLAAATGTDAALATEDLVKSGVPAADLKMPLTEGRMAEILKHYGVEAETANPAATVSRGRAESSLVLVASAGLNALGASAAPGPGSLDDCLAVSKNHGACVNCCKDLGVAANACSRFCVSFTGKPSPSEPLP